jgi:nucleoside-diphosphate-sugar epimerase
VGSWQHPWTVMDRMAHGKPVIVPGDGSSLWVLTWNGDFAKGFVGLLGSAQSIGHAFHITSDEVLTWDAIYQEAARAIGVDANIVHVPSDVIAKFDTSATGSLIGDKATSVVFDNSKIKRFVPDFVCTTPWRDGVRKAVAWFEANAKRRSIDTEANARWDGIIKAMQAVR